MNKEYLNKKIGIIGGGQLGQMMLLEAKKMGFYVIVLDPTEHCPAHSLCDEHIVADFDDEAAFKQLADKTDVITYEFEHINAQALLNLEKNGYTVYPTASSLSIIQDKFLQKEKLSEKGLAVPEYLQTNTIEDIKNAGNVFGYPFMLKTRTGGYDGKGNSLVRTPENIEDCFFELGGGKIPLMAEKLIDFKMETSVLACRSSKGETVAYPVGNNIHKNSILHETAVPAEISAKATEKAMSMAKEVMEVFDGVGMFCVEMFVDKEDNILINEVAPRPHNSGHYTIEGCVTSQFENHIRAIVGLPLGSTKLIYPTVMMNILGEPGYTGSSHVYGMDKALSLPGVFLHVYGKEISKPLRKMGHITAVADNLNEARRKAEEAYAFVKIIGKEDEL